MDRRHSMNPTAPVPIDSTTYVEVECAHWVRYFGFTPLPHQPTVGNPAPATPALNRAQAQNPYFNISTPNSS
jgi:hypothetical protein